MGLPPEKYSYKVIGIIMATFIDKLNLHDVSKTMFLTMFARAKETQRERPLFRDLKAVEIQKKLEASCETFSYVFEKSVYRLLSKVSFIRNLSNRIALFAINSTE